MTEPMTDARLAEIREAIGRYKSFYMPHEMLAEIDYQRAENKRLRALTGDGIRVSVDVGTDDDSYVRLWGRTAGWNDSDDGPVLLVEIDQEDSDHG